MNFLTGPRPDAGFASQRTADDFAPVNITGYDAILIETLASDGKVYALTLKDNVPPNNNQASVSFEYDFTPPTGPGKSLLALAEFNATYQGSIVDVPPLNTSAVLRFAFMMRRYVLCLLSPSGASAPVYGGKQANEMILAVSSVLKMDRST